MYKLWFELLSHKSIGFDDKNILEDEEPSNFKSIVQSHFIEKTVQDSVDGSLFWSIIDLNRLAEGVKEFVHAVQIQSNIDQQES